MSRATVNVWGFKMEVGYDFYEAEPEIRWGDFPHTGSPAYAEIDSVKVGGVEVFEMLTGQQLARIEEAVLAEFQEEA